MSEQKAPPEPPEVDPKAAESGHGSGEHESGDAREDRDEQNGGAPIRSGTRSDD